jgi:hypothetical protein
MKSRNVPVITIAALLAALGGIALAAQDKDTVQVPNGLALSECRGYDDWLAVAVSHPDSMMGASEEPDDVLNLIVANPAMITPTGPAFPATASLSPMAPRLRRSRGNRNRMRWPPFL